MIAKRREGIWFLVGAGKFGYTEGYKSKFTRSELLIQYPWGMHICDYQQKKKRYQPGFKTWYAFGIPRKNGGNTVKGQRRSQSFPVFFSGENSPGNEVE